MRSLPGLGTQYGGFFFLPRQGWSPSILSSPLPPRILSPPLSPVIVSSPPLPSMRSACGVPVMSSGPLVPLKFAARAAVAATSSTTTVTDPSSALCRSKPPSPLKCRCQRCTHHVSEREAHRSASPRAEQPARSARAVSQQSRAPERSVQRGLRGTARRSCAERQVCLDAYIVVPRSPRSLAS